MLDRILVPLDGSPVAASALGFATLIPSRRVALLRVEHLSADGSAATVADLDIAVTALALAAEDLRRHGREVEPMAIGGDPAEEIPRVAEDADLIVMTTRGAGPVHRAVFGSVADRVAHHATVPVLLLRGDNRPTTAPLVSRLVVPLDRSDRAESALSFATDLAGDLGVGLHLLRVVEADPVRDAVRGGPLATGAQSEATERAVSEASPLPEPAGSARSRRRRLRVHGSAGRVPRRRDHGGAATRRPGGHVGTGAAPSDAGCSAAWPTG